MIKDILGMITVAAVVLFTVFCIHLNDSEKKTSNIEARIAHLEQRMGALCVIVYGKSTGFDKAMVRGKNER